MRNYNTSVTPGGCRAIPLLSGIIFGAILALLAWLGGMLGLVTSQHVNRDLGAAHQAFHGGDLTKAIELSRRAWEAHPDYTDALRLLVRALIYRSYSDYDYDDDRQTALQLTTVAIEQHPGLLNVQATHAFALHAAGQHFDAARIATGILQKQPKHTFARMVLGMAYGGIGDLQTARSQLLTVTESQQWQIDAYRALAISHGDLGNYQAALIANEQAIARHEKLLALYFEQAEFALHMGDYDRATAAYFRILATDPDNTKVRLRLCSLSSMLRETTRSITYCKEVIERAPKWADGWYFLGREYFLQGNFADAQSHLNQCTTLLIEQQVPIEARRLDCWYLQGQTAEILGDCEGLLTTYNQFRAMVQIASLPQTWVYPPEGPVICSN